ncbi:ankyrin repeat protein, putative [Trichomonas vaginalis G3]|uniref:Ankyrin repeat protein, putative n=1 Tax=Trichomonas vaginalis (strain ATCC PRA-98 / G3) TaxID=412133 RepID=A2FWR3_TRIV3|nr:hypothetical protein TVAGG3_0248800 [Trichomonas vaginalis G3]EAX90656.1 ankyrin repeat protein, putative [Trichomonas vaginalis G3]KAI5553844.1 hypothetical protein TVAGG3_0248800 [Trichomonas vaginalis G3]|eukprot:XP_001303586.1 ankyrin repeat protein [Trichomonas vaginalis G3]
MLELLISYGAKINDKDKSGRTALIWAVITQDKDIIELLISHGININERDKSGKTALDYASKFNTNAIVELILNGAKRH